MQAKKNLLRDLLLAVLAAIVIVAGLRLLYRFPGPLAEDRQSALAVSTTPPGMDKLRVRMWVDSSVVRADEAAHMIVRFENGTSETISGLAIVDAKEPGFWYQPLVLKAWTLAPGESVESAPVELRPSTGRGRYRVTVRYRAKGADNLVREGAITSPPILIRNEAAERRDLFLRRMLSVFTLPLLLGLIGFWLQRRQAVEARRQEIWKTILPHFYSLSERHYLPIVRSLRAVERTRVANTAAATPEQMRRLLFEFLFLLLRMDIFRKRRGQFFFKSRKGEQVASVAWMILKLGSDEALGATCVEAVLERMTAKMSYREFCYLLATQPEVMELEGKFLAWNRTTEPGRSFYCYTDLVVIMQLAVYFEANRPFDRDWYEVAAEFKMKAPGEYQYPQPATSDSEEEKQKKMDRIESLKKAVASYKAEVTAYLTSLPKPKE